MGTGYATGENRALEAVNLALESPLLDSNDIYGTKNILLNIISGKQEITIGEIGEIIETLQERAGQEADIIWGNGYDETLGDQISVTILATGFITNPNQTLRPKVEPEKFDLHQKVKQEELVEEQPDFPFNDILEEENDEEAKENVHEFEFEVEKQPTVKREKEVIKTTTFMERLKGKEKPKAKRNEPVSESNVDSWFFKNFGLGKLFEDDEDQPLK
jgi:cell division protein FtsZ